MYYDFKKSCLHQNSLHESVSESITDISMALFLGESLLRHIPIRKLINLFCIPPCLFRKSRRVAVKVNDTLGTFRHYGGISLASG